jgi:hypothetical protein
MGRLGGDSPAKWLLKHPLRMPRPTLPLTLPDSMPVPPDVQAVPWNASDKYGIQNPDWVLPQDSFQWRQFRKTVELLQSRNKQVFVVLGPYNEHMLTQEARDQFVNVKKDITKWLEESKVAYSAAELLPSEMYADSSHPLAVGYELMASNLWKSASFQQFLK